MKDKMKVVQIYGAVGAGKTYLLEKVQKILEDKGFNTFHKGDIDRKKDIGYRKWLIENHGSGGQIGSFFIKHLPSEIGANLLIKNPFFFDRAEHYAVLMSKYHKLLNELIKYEKKIYPDESVGRYINMFLEFFSLYEYAKSKDIDVYLTDEQFFQKILMHFSQLNIREHVEDYPSRSMCFEFVMKLARDMEKYVDLNVLVDTDSDTCIKRQKSRKQPEIHAGFTYEERKNEFDEWTRRARRINQVLDIKSFEIENNDGYDGSEIISKRLISLLNI